MELKILQHIDQMRYNEELHLDKVQDKDRFVQTVKDIIDMGWGEMRNYKIKISNDYKFITKLKA